MSLSKVRPLFIHLSSFKRLKTDLIRPTSTTSTTFPPKSSTVPPLSKVPKSTNPPSTSCGTCSKTSKTPKTEEAAPQLESPPPELTADRRKLVMAKIKEIEDQKQVTPFIDHFARVHNYMRISLTEKCNLRCGYCMPEDGVPNKPSDQLLSAEEIVRMVKLMAKRGIEKIRLTGGEPTVRKDLVEIVREIRAIPGIKDIGLTSNGVVLDRMLEELKLAGLDKVNISLDTMNNQRYRRITNRNALGKVLKCIDRAEEVFGKVKVNTVVMRNVNEDEVTSFVKWTEKKNVDVRFIEFMPFGGNNFKDADFVPYVDMLTPIREKYGDLISRLSDDPNDTNKAYKIEGYKGQFGFITSMSEHFCGTCNRLRLTADGKIKVCLHSNEEVSIREALRRTTNDEDIEKLIDQALKRKREKHAGMDLLQQMPNRPMILIGG